MDGGGRRGRRQGKDTSTQLGFSGHIDHRTSRIPRAPLERPPLTGTIAQKELLTPHGQVILRMVEHLGCEPIERVQDHDLNVCFFLKETFHVEEGRRGLRTAIERYEESPGSERLRQGVRWYHYEP